MVCASVRSVANAPLLTVVRMPAIAQEALLVLADLDVLAASEATAWHDVLTACAAHRTEHAATATVALGIGAPDAWTATATWLAPHVRCFVWFPELLDPEDYAAALDALPQARFFHGPDGLQSIRSALTSLGIAAIAPRVDAAGEDALFELQGDYLTRARQAYDEHVRRLPEGEPALSKAWQTYLQRLEGSAGTYGFAELSEAASRVHRLFAVIPNRPDTSERAAEAIGAALDAAAIRHEKLVSDRLPARIELNARFRVLIVADDPATSQQLRLALTHSRLEAVHHEQPHTFAEALELVQPDVLVIQQQLRHFDGLDLAAQVRRHPSFAALPIVALLADTAESTRNRAMHCGVDSWLVRPFSAESAVLVVVNLLRRLEAEQALGGRDAVTGLYSRSALEDRLELELLRARRTGELVGLMLVHITESDQRRYPRKVLLELAQAAESTFRRSDILARYNEQTIAAVLPGADPRVVASLAQRLKDSIDPVIRIEAAASIAEGAVSPAMVMADAETRLIHVLDGSPSAAIGRCVHTATTEPEAIARTPRILLVDGDDAILNLLRFFCAREGLLVDEARDGLAALEYLERASRAHKLPDLIVMEAYLSGIDGFSVLRTVRTHYGARVAVMMLTVQRNEERIAKAFQLGASDFVAKPFSVPEVMARIKNILLRSGAL